MVNRYRVLGGMCTLIAMIGACGSDDATGSAAPSVDAGATDSATNTNSPDAAQEGSTDATASQLPACHMGDREEWSGTIPNTAITVAVCSLCGESYVVASNDGASPTDVSVDNGSMTITASVPSHGTATTANVADNSADGTVSVCATSGSKSCLAMAPVNQRYCNPYRDVASLRAERIDQGVDFGGSGPIYAVGPGTIDLYMNRTDAGWPGGTFVSYKITAGPAMGKVIYLAENVDLNPALKAGSFVYGGTVIGTLVDASPDSEMGWGVAGAGYTAEHACYVEGCDTVLGDNFNQLLTCLHATPGLPGSTGCCTDASGWPMDWCGMLATWQ
jgi:hypothetical protein